MSMVNIMFGYSINQPSNMQMANGIPRRGSIMRNISHGFFCPWNNHYRNSLDPRDNNKNDVLPNIVVKRTGKANRLVLKTILRECDICSICKYHTFYNIKSTQSACSYFKIWMKLLIITDYIFKDTNEGITCVLNGDDVFNQIAFKETRSNSSRNQHFILQYSM